MLIRTLLEVFFLLWFLFVFFWNLDGRVRRKLVIFRETLSNRQFNVSFPFCEPIRREEKPLRAHRKIKFIFVALLLESGANVNLTGFFQGTPLLDASWQGRAGIVRLLLEHGADPDQPDVDGDTPRSCATDDPQLASLFSFEVPVKQ